jgi:uncharacterized protein YdhG (YjbR/CyaY superfamily)
MKPQTRVAANIDEYIAAFPAAVQRRLQSIRRTVKKVVPDAQERISYQIPTFTLGGNLIHFAAFKTHIGVYPGPAAIEALRADLAGFRTAKGTVQFPLDAPMPLTLIERLVRFRIAERSRRANTGRARPRRTRPQV